MSQIFPECHSKQHDIPVRVTRNISSWLDLPRSGRASLGPPLAQIKELLQLKPLRLFSTPLPEGLARFEEFQGLAVDSGQIDQFDEVDPAFSGFGLGESGCFAGGTATVSISPSSIHIVLEDTFFRYSNASFRLLET
jgi:hypothetical protein